jgi:hypothetical protein
MKLGEASEFVADRFAGANERGKVHPNRIEKDSSVVHGFILLLGSTL